MAYPDDRKYTNDHEWINIEDHDAAVVGITLHAQDALGDVVYVDLPEVGRSYAKGEVAALVDTMNTVYYIAGTQDDGSVHQGVGITDGIDDMGALLVRSGDRVERIVAGEVRWGFHASSD